MPENWLSAAAVAAVPEDHRWCIRCLGWYVGRNKTTHGVMCTDPDFKCDHDKPGTWKKPSSRPARRWK